MIPLIHKQELMVMSKSVLEAQAFQDEHAAYAWVEARVWPEGPICPHCGGTDRIGKLQGKSTRVGVYKCYQCRKPFTVKVGTVFEDSHVPMRFWLQAMHLLCSSKKGISSNQLHRTLGVTLKTAWFMSHRLREAMRVVGVGPLGGAGKIVEADETLMGKVEGAPKKLHTGGSQNRNIVLTLVERGGAARSFRIDGMAIRDFMPIIRANVAKETRMNTDEGKHYNDLAKEFAGHDTVNHSEEEYARKTNVHHFPSGECYIVTTNTVEGYYSIFKRGMKGIYQHCSEKHLHRYLAEYDFRYSNRIRLGIDDVQRTEIAIKGIVGKRLTYRTAGH
jgi:transposase-like protein